MIIGLQCTNNSIKATQAKYLLMFQIAMRPGVFSIISTKWLKCPMRLEHSPQALRVEHSASQSIRVEHVESVQRVGAWAAELDAPAEPHAVDGLALAVEGARRADDSARGVDAEALPIAAAYAAGMQEAVAHGAVLALVPVHREDLVHEEAGLTLLRVGGWGEPMVGDRVNGGVVRVTDVTIVIRKVTPD